MTTPPPDRPVCAGCPGCGGPDCAQKPEAAHEPMAVTPPWALSPIHELRAAGWRIQGWADADPDDQFGPLLSAWIYRVAQDWGPPESSGPYDAPEALALARLINAAESR